MRSWPLVTLLVLASVTLAGCTSPDEPAAPSPMPGDGAPPAPGPAPGGNAPQAPAAKPNVQPVTDTGTIQGTFEKSWTLEIPKVGFRDVTVSFSLKGVEESAPPTARVQLALLDAQGALVKTGLVGLGAENALEWALTPADLPAAGTYTLQATSQADAPGGALPSLGLAKYDLYAMPNY